jgi:transposase InsO family protein
MGQVLHGCARTTSATRRDIQNSKETLASLAQRFDINPKTVRKWRSRRHEGVGDRSNRPHKTRTVLSAQDEAIVVTFRLKSQLPLDDCLDALIEQIPHLTRSNLHRCLQRNGISRLPKEQEQTAQKKKFKDYPIGYVHVDITEVRLGKVKYHMFVGICRVCKFAYVEVFERATVANSCLFLEHLVAACPFKIHTILSDNGVQFAYTKNTVKRGKGPSKRHRFDLACAKYAIHHRRTRPYTPQTNGQVERMNRTIKDATTKAYHYSSIEQFLEHLNSFILAYTTGKRLSAIQRKTPYQEIIRWYQKQPKLFNKNPNHQLLGLNN